MSSRAGKKMSKKKASSLRIETNLRNIIKDFISEITGDYYMRGSRRMDAPGNIRSGMFVVGNRGNVLSDEDVEFYPQPESVCLIVKGAGGKLLSVSRGRDTYDMNLPGGGIEMGETPEEAARRELKEETGLDAGEMVEIYTGPSRSKVCTAFEVLDYSGKIRGSSEGFVKWSTPDELMNGTFGEFFRTLIKR